MQNIQNLGAGILTVEVSEGNLTHDTEMLGKMSPYCILVHSGNK